MTDVTFPCLKTCKWIIGTSSARMLWSQGHWGLVLTWVIVSRFLRTAEESSRCWIIHQSMAYSSSSFSDVARRSSQAAHVLFLSLKAAYAVFFLHWMRIVAPLAWPYFFHFRISRTRAELAWCWESALIPALCFSATSRRAFSSWTSAILPTSRWCSSSLITPSEIWNKPRNSCSKLHHELIEGAEHVVNPSNQAGFIEM